MISETSKPSSSSSPWIRGAPHPTFISAISTISLRTSAAMRGEEAKLPSRTAPSALPSPEELTRKLRFLPLAMSGQNGRWLHHCQTLPPATPEAREQRPEDTIDRTKPGAMPLVNQARKLVAQRNILSATRSARSLNTAATTQRMSGRLNGIGRIIASAAITGKSQLIRRQIQ